MNRSILMLPLMVMAITCTRKTQSAAAQGEKLIEMDKSPCFGLCPVYRLTVYRDGLMKMDAKQNMKISGLHTLQLNKADIASLRSKLEKMGLEKYQEEYREPVADAPSTELRYYIDGKPKRIFTNFIFPAPLQKITEELDQWAMGENWAKWIDPRIKKEFILLLEEGVPLSNILQKFSEQDMMPVRRLDPATRQYWLVTCLVMPGEEKSLMEQLRKDAEIREVQENRTLEERQ
ncbi:MAG TPA: DUF6438 domain-containing protein [Saprospiraceae bacterium]|nr:DUF6438 domain-containing protein [Saprospiraceae bacterium]HNT21986.1 DUF6438 domain-containing protein [Saprospiraceae bacterium]